MRQFARNNRPDAGPQPAGRCDEADSSRHPADLFSERFQSNGL
jgi:hypothetical protein